MALFYLSSKYLVVAVDRSHHEPHASPPNKESDDEPLDLTQYTHKQSNETCGGRPKRRVSRSRAERVAVERAGAEIVHG